MAARPRVRVAIIGAGMVGQAHAHGFRVVRQLGASVPEVELAVVADVDEALAADTQARFGFERTARSWEEVAEADDVDAAIVALANAQHREVSEALMARGKHVLCEKPLANTAADAYAMLQAARRAGVVHGVGFMLRRTPAVAALQRIVARGDFGELHAVRARYFTDYAANPQVPFTWRYRRDQAGSGALGDIGSHVIDVTRFLLGEIEDVSGATLATYIPRRPIPAGHVTGHSVGATTGEFGEVDTDDVSGFVGRFAGGALGTFHFSRIATGYRNSPAIELIGSRAAAEFDTERIAEFQYFDASTEGDANGFRRVLVGPPHPYFSDTAVFKVAGVGSGYNEAFVAQAAEFARAITSDSADYRPSFEDGYQVALVCESVQQAAEQGRTVRIADVAARAEGR
jgi:predicted dehydrogenase